jgi:RiboL-PSP-HEPN
MSQVVRALGNLGYRTGQLKQGIIHAERVLAGSSAASVEILASQRAATYVTLAAAVEVFVREFVDDLISDLNALGLTCDRVRPSLLSLVHSPDFDALRALNGLKMWNRRVVVLEAVRTASALQFSTDIRPLDGRTIRPRHLETIWSVFGLPGAPLATPAHGLALTELAEARNNIAHGHVDPITFGRRKALSDVVSAIDRVDDIALHMALAADGYFSQAEYLR